MKIFVINLERDTNKKEKIQKLMDKANISVEFFKAVDGTTHHENHNFTGWVDPYHCRYVTKGEVGCALSHYYIWEKIINEKIEKAIILEDDVEIIDHDFVNKVNNIDKNIEYDLLYLSRKKITDEKEEDLIEDVVVASPSYWTCAYVITLEGAKKIKNDIFFNNITPIDEYLPYLYSNTYLNKTMDIVFGNIPKIKAVAFKNNLLKPEGNSFQISSTFFSEPCDKVRDDILLVTVATDMNDPLKRYISSCKQFGFKPIVLGLGKTWNGGNMAEGPGGGQKIIFLQEYLKTLDENKLVIFTDSYDVICNNNINNLCDIYNKDFSDKIVFATENSCWPDRNLENFYPKVDNKQNIYLNSGLFMGYSNDIRKLIDKDIRPHEDDQLYYTEEFLYNRRNIELDYENKLFLCLNGDQEVLRINKSKSQLLHNNIPPIFLHGNGPPEIKRRLNYISNYTVSNYNSTYGYKNINNLKDFIPDITIIFEEIKSPNNDVIRGLCNIEYPRDKINFIYLYNKIPEEEIINSFKKVLNFDTNKSNFVLKERTDDKTILETTEFIKFNKVFYINSSCIIEYSNILKELLSENKSFIGPVMSKENGYFSNFWGDLGNDNFYKRSENYFNILQLGERSCWNVPYLGYCFLTDKCNFTRENLTNNLEKGDGWDMALCYNLRKSNIFIHALNTEKFGLLTDEEGVKNSYISFQNLKITDFKGNERAWKEKYFHKNFDPETIMEEIGNNVNKIQIFNELFCSEIINVVEKDGIWSKGGDRYFDDRIGGLENHPTQDIHLNKVGLEEMWKWFVDTFVSKLVWNKYKYSYKDINISFVVKYDMNGQRELKSHHDSSTFTVNLCLNSDFEGGGCYFIKDNLKCINKDIGSIILHPGKLTHYHQGLPITSGKRLILVSFID